MTFTNAIRDNFPTEQIIKQRYLHNFGKRLSQSLKNSMISGKQLATYLDVSQSSVYGWLQGRTFPSIPRLIQLAYFFNVSPDWLLGISATEQDASQRSIQEIDPYQPIRFSYLHQPLKPKYNQAVNNILVNLMKMMH